MKTVLMGLLLLSTTAAFAQKLDCDVTMGVNDGSGERKETNEYVAEFKLDLASGIDAVNGKMDGDLEYQFRASLNQFQPSDKVGSVLTNLFVFRRVDGKIAVEARNVGTVSLLDSVDFQTKGVADIYSDVINHKLLNVISGTEDDSKLAEALAAADQSGAYKIGDWSEVTVSCVIRK